MLKKSFQNIAAGFTVADHMPPLNYFFLPSLKHSSFVDQTYAKFPHVCPTLLPKSLGNPHDASRKHPRIRHMFSW